MEIHITDSKPSPWKEVLFHGFFLALFIMAIVYFKERLYSDSGYYVAHMVDSGFFYIGNQRLVLALSQVVPLIVMAMGFGLKSILIAYSIGNVLFFYVLFLIVLYKYKDEVSALLLILLQVVGTTWIYFSPMIEICYGAALLVLFYCILTKAKLTPINIVTLIILEIFILTSHPENFILFFFVLAAEILRKGFRKKIHPILISVFIALIIFKSFTFGNYEGGKLNYMFDLKQNHLYENLFKSQYISSLVRLFTTYYPELVVMFIFVVFAFVKRKAYSLLSLFIITILGFIALVNATNYAGEYGRYNEALYFPVVLMISITFMIDVFKVLENKWRNIILIGLSIAFIERMVTISSLGNYLSMRTDQMENIIQTAHKKGISKCIITLANSEEGKWALNWSYPMESLLISSIAGPDSAVSIITDEDMAERDTSVALTENNFLFRRWEIREDQSMRKYFRLGKENYVSLNTSDSTITADRLSGKVELMVDERKIKTYNNRTYVPVKIRNSSGFNLPSKNIKDVNLSVSNRDGKAVIIPLDIDIDGDYLQYVAFDKVQSKGEVHLKLNVNNVVVADARFFY